MPIDQNRKSLFFGILIILLTTMGFAQEGSENTNDPGIPKLIFRSNLITVINPFKQSASITVDYHLSSRLSIDVSLGYFFHNGVRTINEKGHSYRGPQFRIGTKYYFNTQNNYPWYIGLEAKHNRIDHYEWDNILRQGNQFGDLFFIHRQIHTWGVGCRFGALIYLDRSKNFILDIYGGLSSNQHTVKDDIPEDAERLTRGQLKFLYPKGVTTLPGLIIGLHLGYAFW